MASTPLPKEQPRSHSVDLPQEYNVAVKWNIVVPVTIITSGSFIPHFDFAKQAFCVSCKAAKLLPVRHNLATPNSANFSAVPAPIPELAPVIIATSLLENVAMHLALKKQYYIKPHILDLSRL